MRMAQAVQIKIEQQTDKLLERIVDVESQTVLGALEKRVTALETDMVALRGTAA